MNVHTLRELCQKHIFKRAAIWPAVIVTGVAIICTVVIVAYKLNAGNAHAANEGENNSKDKLRVLQLSQEACKLADIEVQPAKPGILQKELEATGEITLNGDTLTHVKPYVSGIVVEVFKNIGDKVVAGEPLAVMLAPDLGKAKIDYFSAKQNLDLARIDLDREKKVYDNTVKLLNILKSNPDTSELEKIAVDSIGENKSKLLGAYAAQRLTQSSLNRALKLKERNIVSQASAEVAVKENESAQAEFNGVFEEINFSHKSRYVQAERAMQVAETSYRNAKRYLYILGLSDNEIEKMSSEKDEDVARFVLKASRSGTIIEKHISIGERIKDEVDYPDCFVIADLSSVWVDINIYISSMDSVKPMQTVNLEIVGHEGKYTGKLLSVSPTIAEKTRTANARAVLNNAEGKLKPGLFTTARITLEEINCPVLVPLEAVQVVDDQAVVFVQSKDNKFLVQPVVLGAKDTKSYEIKEGLSAETPIVVKNAFTLRTELDKEGLESD